MAQPSIIKVDFGKDNNPLLEKRVKDMVEHIHLKMRKLRDELLPKWAMTYKGKPEMEEAKFPWPGAANLVVQVAGTHCDELLSRVMAIWNDSPIYRAELYADFDDGEGADLKSYVEDFLDKMAFEPAELDLYRVEETFFGNTVKYGTGIIKFPYEYLIEKKVVSINGAANTGSDSYHSTDVIRRDGPHPESVPLHMFGIDSIHPNLQNADFIYHVITKHKTQVEDMLRHPEIYDKEAIKKILTDPDRDGPDEFKRKTQESKETESTAGNECSHEWDIYECWHKYWHNNNLYNIISYFHKRSETYLGSIFNFYPDNIWPFEDAKLAYDSDDFFGFGFCEMLWSYQEEISKMHNWRRNAKDFAMTGIGRINKNSKLSSIVQLFPGLLVPADEGEIEPLAFGAQSLTVGTDEEQLALSLAKERSGVDPAIGGTGGGIVNQKRGIYSAQGTAIVMQQQNNRNNLRMNDMRTSHVRMGRKLLLIYSHFGLGTKLRQWGDKAQKLEKALQLFRDGKLGLGIRAATASSNRELEKQNGILLSATLERLYNGNAQIIQALATKGAPPELIDYYKKVLLAKDALMADILHSFGKDDISRLIPVPAILKENRQNGSGVSGGGNGQISPLQIGGGGMVPVGNGSGFSPVPTGSESGQFGNT